jgi:hypothetical protein
VLNRIVNERDQFAPSQKPILAIFASLNDYPVRYFFPVGRWAGTGLQRLASDAADQERAAVGARRTDETTKLLYRVGYIDEFETHSLDLGVPPDSQFAGIAAASLTPEFLRQREIYEAKQLAAFNATWNRDGFLQQGWSRRYTDGAILTHKAKFPNNPFYVVKVDAALIDGHNGIWRNQQWLDFLRQFYDEIVDHPMMPV